MTGLASLSKTAERIETKLTGGWRGVGGRKSGPDQRGRLDLSHSQLCKHLSDFFKNNLIFSIMKGL